MTQRVDKFKYPGTVIVNSDRGVKNRINDLHDSNYSVFL